MTYCEAIDTLCTMYENACLEYELDVITEAASEDGSQSDADKSKVMKFVNTIVNILKKFWGAVRSLFLKISAKVKAVKGTLVLSKDIQVCKAFVDLDMTIFNEAAKVLSVTNMNKDDDFEFDKKVQEGSRKTELKAGTKINADRLLNYVDRVTKLADKVNNSIQNPNIEFANVYNEKIEDFANEVRYKQSISTRMMSLVNELMKDVTLFVNSSTMGKEEANKKMHDIQNNLDKTFGESVTLADNKRKAKILIEAAEILESEVIQKAVEDIPEEKPDEAKEYPEDTSGGEGLREDHLEDTKELVDDSKEAVDIMTEDENSKTISESIDISLDFDF